MIDNVTPDMRIAWEEPFGPVLPFMRVPSVDVAIEHINANRLALQVGRAGRQAAQCSAARLLVLGGRGEGGGCCRFNLVPSLVRAWLWAEDLLFCD